MKNILKLIKRLSVMHIDKIVHFETCLIITLVIALFWKLEAGVGIGILAGVAKELHDKFLGYKFSIWDIVSDLGGVAVAYLIFIGV